MTTHALSDTDATITRTVVALAAAQELTYEALTTESGIGRSTAFRRRAGGGWTATEVARMALRLGVPVSDLYTGLDGKLGPRPGARSISNAAVSSLPRLDSNQQPLGYSRRGLRPTAAYDRAA